jgi:hypothetical protein
MEENDKSRSESPNSDELGLTRSISLTTFIPVPRLQSTTYIVPSRSERRSGRINVPIPSLTFVQVELRLLHSKIRGLVRRLEMIEHHKVSQNTEDKEHSQVSQSTDTTRDSPDAAEDVDDAYRYHRNTMNEDDEVPPSDIFEPIAVMEDVVISEFTENEIRDIEQASTYVDQTNARIAEKLTVLDHMEARARREMVELEAMLAKL